MDGQEAIDSEKEDIAWYLRDKALTWVAFLLPPIAYLIIFLNYKKLSPNARSTSLFFTSLMMCGWVVKLLPYNTFTFILICTLVAFSTFLVILKLKLMIKD